MPTTAKKPVTETKPTREQKAAQKALGKLRLATDRLRVLLDAKHSALAIGHAKALDNLRARRLVLLDALGAAELACAKAGEPTA